MKEETERLAARLKDWLDNGTPAACKSPPWQAVLDRIDAAKILRLGKGEK